RPRRPDPPGRRRTATRRPGWRGRTRPDRAARRRARGGDRSRRQDTRESSRELRGGSQRLTTRDVRGNAAGSIGPSRWGGARPAGAGGAHRLACPDCATWQGDAQRVTRAVRVQAARVPDLTGSIMAAVAERAGGPRPAAAAAASPDREAPARRQVLRVAVAAA